MVLSLEEYSKLTDVVEATLDKADRSAVENDIWMSYEEIFCGGRLMLSKKYRLRYLPLFYEDLDC